MGYKKEATPGPGYPRERRTTVTRKKVSRVSCRPSQEQQGPVHSPPGCPRACQLKYQVLDTPPQTILPHKCKRRYLNPKGVGVGEERLLFSGLHQLSLQDLQNICVKTPPSITIREKKSHLILIPSLKVNRRAQNVTLCLV